MNEFNRYASLKDLNNYFRIKELLAGLTESQQETLRKNIGALTAKNGEIIDVNGNKLDLRVDSSIVKHGNTTVKELLDRVSDDTEQLDRNTANIAIIRGEGEGSIKQSIRDALSNLNVDAPSGKDFTDLKNRVEEFLDKETDNSIIDTLKEIQSYISDVIKYNEQSLTNEEKVQARKNIGAISINNLNTTNRKGTLHATDGFAVYPTSKAEYIEYKTSDGKTSNVQDTLSTLSGNITQEVLDVLGELQEIIENDPEGISSILSKLSELETSITGVSDELNTQVQAINEAIETLSKKKQDLLKSGENIKTINGESLVGEGNLKINITSDNIISYEHLIEII